MKFEQNEERKLPEIVVCNIRKAISAVRLALEAEDASISSHGNIEEILSGIQMDLDTVFQYAHDAQYHECLSCGDSIYKDEKLDGVVMWSDDGWTHKQCSVVAKAEGRG